MTLTTFAVFSLFTVLNLFTLALAAPLDGVASDYAAVGSCNHLLERKEWYVVVIVCRELSLTDVLRRTLTDIEKKSYIDAVRCLQSQPARNTSRPASYTRFDEFQAHHLEIAYDIHFVVSISLRLHS